MTKRLIETLEALAEQASIGFLHGGVEFTTTDYCEVMLNGCDEVADCRSGTEAGTNQIRAELIATLLNNLPAILSAIRQAGEAERLREALEPFVRHYELNDCDEREGNLEVPISDLRRARQALKGTTDD